VYTKHLTRELAGLGHEVTVFAGQPYPEVTDGVELVRVPSLDLYREPEPFRLPRAREIESPTDLLEVATMWTGGFPEPRTFSLRARQVLRSRLGEHDVVHDDQSLGTGLLQMMSDGWAVTSSIHHPVTVDRALDLEHAPSRRRRVQLRRWYGFTAMQAKVARRLPRVLTVSESSRRDLVEQLGVDPSRVAVVPIGVDPNLHRPRPSVARVEGRVMTTASADVPMKGLVFLLEALAKVRTDHPSAHLVVVGRLRSDSRVAPVVERLDLGDAVRFVAETLPENHAMLAVFDDLGLAVARASHDGAVDVTIELATTPRYLAARDDRERRSIARSLRPLLKPQSIAVVGASRHPGSAGHEILRSLLAFDFNGRVYPVNPSARSICGVPSYPDIAAVPEPVDLAVVAVPGPAVLDVVRQCAAAGVGSLAVVSSGFAETGAAGREQELVLEQK